MALANPQPAVPLEPPPVSPGAPSAPPAAPIGGLVVQDSPAGDVVVSTTPAPPMAGMVQFMMSGQGMAMAAAKRPASGPASRFEWRTPPLWGFRDSGPYLHDGRAATLEQAVALHGGEAAGIAQRFFSLKPVERLKVEAFLKSLSAPDRAGPEQLASAR
jgi:cytochrome c peroxidase